MRAWTRLFVFLLLLVGLSVPALTQDNASLPISEDVYYLIRPGDTLDAIGAMFDMSPRCIILRNNIERPSELIVGEEILLPVSCPRYAEDPTYLPTSPVLTPRLVVSEEPCEGVRASYSDTITALARMLRVGEELLRETNNLGPDEEPTYQQCIVLPASMMAGDGQGGGGTGIPEGEYYVVTFGDTLDQIAMTNNVSLQTLRIVNGIADNKALLAGTTLFIPADAPAYGEYPAIFRLDQFGQAAGEEYVVQPGDMLDTIAQEFDVSVIALMMANGIENNRFIQAGTVIIIPEGAARYGEFPPIMRGEDGTETLGQGGGGLNEYVVQPGDYPEKIAREVNVDLITFMDANGIENSYRLMPGTVLIIPEGAPPFSEDGIPPVSVRPANQAEPTTDASQPVESQPTPTLEAIDSAPALPTNFVATPTNTIPAPNNVIPSPVTTEEAP